MELPRLKRAVERGSGRFSRDCVSDRGEPYWLGVECVKALELADLLDRDYRAVHEDVTLLADYGLVFVIEEGQSKRPYLPYRRIHLDVELVGGEPGEEPATA